MTSLLELEKHLHQLKQEMNHIELKDKLSMIVFSGDLDRILAAFIIATGAAAMDTEVVMFFTFWATAALREPNKRPGKKDLFGKLFGIMLPKGAKRLKLSKMNIGGCGTLMLKQLMKKKNVKSLDELLKIAAELGVKINICQMSMDLMGFTPQEMIDYPHLNYVGVASFLGHAQESKMQLFI